MNPPDQPTGIIMGHPCGQPLHDLVHRTPAISPTPRTDAAWSKTFEDELNQFWSGNAANKMRDECETLERELAIAQNWVEHHSQHADDLIGENTRLRDEVERWKTVAATMSQEREHNANEASRLRAEVERWKTVAAEMSQQREHNANEASRLRAEVANKTASIQIAADRIDELKLRAEHWCDMHTVASAEVERLKGVRTAAEAIMTDVAEANEEIAIARAEKAEAELISLRAEVRQARKAWLGGDYDHLPLIEAMEKFRNDRENEFEAVKADCERLQHLDSLLSQAAADVTAHAVTAGELAHLRAEVERLKQVSGGYYDSSKAWMTSAEKAEAALAEAKVERETVAQSSLRSLEAYIDKLKQFAERAEKAEADTARLDWLAVSDTWFDYPATESFNPETFRDAIDAAMKGTP